MSEKSYNFSKVSKFHVRFCLPDISATVVAFIVVVVNMLSVDSAALVVPGADFLGELGPSVVVLGAAVVVVVAGMTGSSSSKGKTFPATSTIPE